MIQSSFPKYLYWFFFKPVALHCMQKYNSTNDSANECSFTNQIKTEVLCNKRTQKEHIKNNSFFLTLTRKLDIHLNDTILCKKSINQKTYNDIEKKDQRDSIIILPPNHIIIFQSIPIPSKQLLIPQPHINQKTLDALKDNVISLLFKNNLSYEFNFKQLQPILLPFNIQQKRLKHFNNPSSSELLSINKISYQFNFQTLIPAEKYAIMSKSIFLFGVPKTNIFSFYLQISEEDLKKTQVFCVKENKDINVFLYQNLLCLPLQLKDVFGLK
jgi:hypothetical protein